MRSERAKAFLGSAARAAGALACLGSGAQGAWQQGRPMIDFPDPPPEPEPPPVLSIERFSPTDLWNYELLKIGGQTISVQTVFVGVVLVVLGYFAARLISQSVRSLVARRVSMSGSGAAALETVIFYLLLVMFSLSALTIAGVPLTAFTLLGGAAAIGVGFGSQTIVSNFIAGLILLIERPIKVGNLIQVGDLFGTIQHVGTRSTRVLTGANVEIIVPNSAFLEQNVINWTLSSPKVRVNVAVGVAYGSDTEKVRELLLKAVDVNPKALSSPAPILLFTDFGDNSLGFEIHFWIEMKQMMDRKRVESEMRFTIDNLFREAGVTIAFPQRDVHLDNLSPIEVRVLEPEP